MAFKIPHLLLCLAIAGLSGCHSDAPDLAPAPAAPVATEVPTPPSAPMTIATLPPPSPTPTPIASLTPSPITANSLTPGEPLIAPDAQAQSDRDGQNRREVMRLRGEIRGLERQKAMLQSRRDEYRAQRMEREKESGFSGPPDGAEYSTSLDIDNLDDQIMGKQRDIDTAMMRR